MLRTVLRLLRLLEQHLHVLLLGRLLLGGVIAVAAQDSWRAQLPRFQLVPVDVCEERVLHELVEARPLAGVPVEHALQAFFGLVGEILRNLELAFFDVLVKDLDVVIIISVSYTHLTLPTILRV